MKFKHFLFFLVLIIVGFGFTANGQGVSNPDFGSGYLEDEGTSLWDEGGFLDDTGENDGQYLGEEEIRA